MANQRNFLWVVWVELRDCVLYVTINSVKESKDIRFVVSMDLLTICAAKMIQVRLHTPALDSFASVATGVQRRSVDVSEC